MVTNPDGVPAWWEAESLKAEHVGKAKTAHNVEHCRERWCGRNPPEPHPLSDTPAPGSIADLENKGLWPPVTGAGTLDELRAISEAVVDGRIADAKALYATAGVAPTRNPDNVPAWWNNARTFGPEQDVKPQPETPLEPSMRVRSTDYGDGTVVAIVATGVQIMWDKPWLEGTTGPQLLTHEHRFAAGLERL